MNFQKIKIDQPDVFEIVNSYLQAGGVVMHPTETCYGLAVDIFNRGALEKLYQVKRMSNEKPVSIMVSSLEEALKYAVFSSKAHELAKKYWPGPLSLVLPRKDVLPEYLNFGNDFISLRFSGLDFCQKMVMNLGMPVTTTSANRTGEKELYFAQAVDGVDLLVDGGEIVNSQPSTIVKVDGGKCVVIRRGALLIEEIIDEGK